MLECCQHLRLRLQNHHLKHVLLHLEELGHARRVGILLRRYVGLNLPHLGGQGMQEAEQLVFRLHALPVHNVNPRCSRSCSVWATRTPSPVNFMHASVSARGESSMLCGLAFWI